VVRVNAHTRQILGACAGGTDSVTKFVYFPLDTMLTPILGRHFEGRHSTFDIFDPHISKLSMIAINLREIIFDVGLGK
jgi:hypothetical protein